MGAGSRQETAGGRGTAYALHIEYRPVLSGRSYLHLDGDAKALGPQ